MCYVKFSGLILGVCVLREVYWSHIRGLVCYVKSSGVILGVCVLREVQWSYIRGLCVT